MKNRNHYNNEGIAKLLEYCKCIWEVELPGRGNLYCYSTRNGTVIFHDFKSGGWTMYTEHPSNKISDAVSVLEDMVTL